MLHEVVWYRLDFEASKATVRLVSLRAELSLPEYLIFCVGLGMRLVQGSWPGNEASARFMAWE